MINHIKILCLLVISSLILAQPVKVDSNKVSPSNAEVSDIPSSVKPVVEEIVTNSRESRAASEELTKEMKKQIALVKEIKRKILLREIKKHNNPKPVEKIVSAKPEDKIIVDTTAIKSKDIIIEVEGQVVQWETKDRSWFGRLFHSTDVLFYPYIIDKTGKKIYLK